MKPPWLENYLVSMKTVRTQNFYVQKISFWDFFALIKAHFGSMNGNRTLQSQTSKNLSINFPSIYYQSS